MADSKYGRLFTEQDVMAIVDEALMLNLAGNVATVPELLRDLIARAEADKAPMRFPADEPLFLLRAQDTYAAPLVSEYATRCRKTGVSDEHVNGALGVVGSMLAWQGKHPDRVKVPD